MIRHGLEAIEVLAVLGTFSSVAYYVLVLWGALAFLRERNAGINVRAGESPAPTQSTGPTQFTPPVTILKPLKGTDREMYESFRSHCLQAYPECEIIFGVSDAQDPAVALVHKLQAEFPQQTIRLVLCDNHLGANTKVSNLAQMLPQARYEYLIVNDSDIRVGPDYLRRVLSPLADANIGMVTCLYRGIAGSTLGACLESLTISTDFCAGVLAARQLEGGIRFGLGATLAFRRKDLQAIGGFEGLADYLADDYELGSRVCARGSRVQLSELVVETFLPPYTLSAFLQHQLRWARAVRDSRPWGYLGFAVTFGLPWALLTLLLAQGAVWAWGLLAVVAAMRFAVALVVGRSVLKDRQVPRLLWLIPLRDIVALLIWMASFTGHTVHWSGDSFILRNGKLSRANV